MRRVLSQREMSKAAMARPANYNDLTPQQQWEIDKQLGILDWDGAQAPIADEDEPPARITAHDVPL